MSVATLLNKTAALSRPTRTEEAPGQWADNYVPVDSAYKCRIMPGSGTDMQEAARREATVTHAIYGTTGTLQRGDRVTDAADVYTVRYVIQPSVAIYDKAMAEQVQIQDAAF